MTFNIIAHIHAQTLLMQAACAALNETMVHVQYKILYNIIMWKFDQSQLPLYCTKVEKNFANAVKVTMSSMQSITEDNKYYGYFASENRWQVSKF